MDYAIACERQPRQPYLAVRRTIRTDEIGAIMGPLYAELFERLGRIGVQPEGPAWVRYLAIGPVECELELAAPVKLEIPGDGRIISGVMPACDVLKTLHTGPYDDMTAAYAALNAWMSEHRVQPAGAPCEIYLSDPQREPDPAGWKTLICFPVTSC